MVLRWADMMRDCSFDGIVVPAISISARGGRTLALHTYPDVPGQEVEDQGRNAAMFSIEAIWAPDLSDQYGDDIYPGGWQEFKRRMEKGGSGTLVLPVWGDVECAVQDWSWRESARTPDRIDVSITFVEDSLEPFSLADSTALSKIVDAETRAENVDIEMRSRFSLSLDLNPFGDLIASLRLILFTWNSLQYAIESRYARIRADFRVLVDLYGLDTSDNWDLMEEVILMQRDMVDSVAAFEVDFPMFESEVIPGDTTLFDLSIKYYGDRDRWEDLLSLNSSVVSNPAHVPAGTTITHQVDA